MELQECLNQMWATIIEKLEFNIIEHTITLQLKAIDNGIENQVFVVFGDVTAYYFINNTGEQRDTLTLYEEDDYLELTSIYYYGDGIGNIEINSSPDLLLEKYFSSANFVLEIWSAMLFIEAKTFYFDGNVFKVK